MSGHGVLAVVVTLATMAQSACADSEAREYTAEIAADAAQKIADVLVAAEKACLHIHPENSRLIELRNALTAAQGSAP